MNWITIANSVWRVMLEIDKLSFSYTKDKVVFRDLSLILPTSKCIVLTGRSGTGKSSLCRILSKKLNNYNGNINFKKTNIKNIEDKEYYDYFHFMDQNPQHNFIGLTAERDFTLWNDKTQLDLFSQLLSKYKLADKKEELLWNLSFGEQKSLFFVYLEYFKRNIWVLDEPIEGLDTHKKKLFLDLCNTHLKDSGSILVTSHRPDDFTTLNPEIINLEEYL